MVPPTQVPEMAIDICNYRENALCMNITETKLDGCDIYLCLDIYYGV